SDLQLWPDLAAPLNTNFDKFADTALIDGHKWISGKDAPRSIDAEKTRRVIARNPERRLRTVTRTECAKFGALRHFIGQHRGTRQFDHRAALVIDFRFFLLCD